MKEGWQIRKLGEVCKVTAGQSPDGKYYNNTGIGMPFYQGKKEFKEKFIGQPTTWTSLVTKLADKGDILMSVRAPVGPINYSTQKICIGRGLAAIKASKTLITDYLYYFLLNNENQLVGNAGAVFNSITKKQIEDISFPIPPLPEQQRIVAILDEAFASINKAKENAQQNLKNAKELFDGYLQSVFENKINGRESYELIDLCDLIVDCEHKTAPIQESGYPSIRTPNIGKGELDLDNVNRVSHATYIEWTRRAIPMAGDLILAREAPAGNIAVIPDNLKVCLGQRTVLIRPKKQKFISKYLAYLILSPNVQEILLSQSRGATVEHVNMKDIRAFKIYDLSPLPEQRRIVQNLDALRDETKKLESIYNQKLNDLEELKKSILQKAFAGELTH
jgi:type I restriction enzyme, S subunit